MNQLTRSTLAVAVAAAAIGVSAAPALAKSEHFTIGGKAAETAGAKLVGVTCTSTLGKCSTKGSIAPPDTFLVWKVPGGTIKATAVSLTGLANASHGTFKITGGTGKYKHATGHGTFKGTLSSGTFTYKGTLKF